LIEGEKEEKEGGDLYWKRRVRDSQPLKDHRPGDGNVDSRKRKGKENERKIKITFDMIFGLDPLQKIDYMVHSESPRILGEDKQQKIAS
jgi:hypothetical protein